MHYAEIFYLNYRMFQKKLCGEVYLQPSQLAQLREVVGSVTWHVEKYLEARGCNLHWVLLYLGYMVVQLVEALCYKMEGRGFDSLWCHWNFPWT